MGKSLSILCVHGIGHQEADLDFRASWVKAITSAVQSCDPELVPRIDFFDYDDLFDHAPLNALTYGIAFSKLLASAVIYGADDVLSRTRGISDLPETIQWTAGMVAQWVSEAKLRTDTRTKLLAQINAQAYQAVFAHSLGSLVCYDTFVKNPDAIKGKVFVSLGSQIGNPAVRDVFAGRIQALSARTWYHLFNPDDHVLTCPINLRDDNFKQTNVRFDIPNDFLNHNATWYLGHANTVSTVWRELTGVSGAKSLGKRVRSFAKAVSKPNRRALLIGINNYPDPANRLEGCVNDVFLMSSVLQENGFAPEEIRIVLDERATKRGITDRLQWLLDGVRDGDQRVLFYSGHGAQIPGYGANDEPDHIDECLVPVDFDWSLEHAILDKQFCELYSQLPYDSHFVALFDCCHSGGLTRDGAARIRGITPPDDIRHRALRWVAQEQMWVARDFSAINRSLAEKKGGDKYLGSNSATNRLGRAAALRTLPNAEYDKLRKTLGHYGPYLPILLEACEEHQFSYEYKHGAIAYGAYTFCLAQVLRASGANGINLSFEELNLQVTTKLRRLNYNQSPVLVGAKDRVTQPVSWYPPVKPAKAGSGAKTRRK